MKNLFSTFMAITLVTFSTFAAAGIIPEGLFVGAGTSTSDNTDVFFGKPLSKGVAEVYMFIGSQSGSRTFVPKAPNTNEEHTALHRNENGTIKHIHRDNPSQAVKPKSRVVSTNSLYVKALVAVYRTNDFKVLFGPGVRTTSSSTVSGRKQYVSAHVMGTYKPTKYLTGYAELMYADENYISLLGMMYNF